MSSYIKNYAIAALLIFACQVSHAEEKGTIPMVKNPAMEKLAQEIKPMRATPEMESGLQDTLKIMKTDAWKTQQSQMKDELRSILGLEPDPSQKVESLAEKATPTPGMPRGMLYIFISRSVPLETLRNYAFALRGTDHAVMVLRGFVGSATELKETARFVHDIIKVDADCHSAECETWNIEVDVDPIPFIRYGITSVPAIAYDKNVLELGHCDDPDALPGKVGRRQVQVVYGDAALGAAVARLQKLSHEPDLTYFKKKWSK